MPRYRNYGYGRRSRRVPWLLPPIATEVGGPELLPLGQVVAVKIMPAPDGWPKADGS
jgi:hypothetical protein